MFRDFVVLKNIFDLADDLGEGPVGEFAGGLEVFDLAGSLDEVGRVNEVFHFHEGSPVFRDLSLCRLGEIAVVLVLQENADFLEGRQFLQCPFDVRLGLVGFDVSFHNLNFGA